MKTKDQPMLSYVSDKDMQLNVIVLFIKLIELKDKYTAEHCKRVADIAVRFGQYLNIPQDQMEILMYSAILHDIGKIGIPEEILNKKGRLNEEEMKIMKNHTIKGIKAIEEIQSLNKVLDVIVHHHEKLDGTGYPDGIKSDEISTLCKIVALADSFDAMTSNRSYRRAMYLDNAVEEIEKNKGTQFDEKLAESFISFIKKYNEIQ